jgi:hypothetical protein
MKINSEKGEIMRIIGIPTRWLSVSLGLLLTATSGLPTMAAPIPTVQIGTVTYSNVTVYSQTEKDLYISHAGGLQNIKMSLLDAPALRALGLLEEAEQAEIAAASENTAWPEQISARLEGAGIKISKDAINERLTQWNTPPPKQTLIIAISIAVLFYLFICYCLKRICQNAGGQPGVLIWLPVLQMIPLLRAAQMSPWLLLLFFVPLVNIVVQIWWTFRIVKACGKGVLVAIFLLLPLTNLFAFLYLAFSSNEGGNADTAHSGPVKLGGLASA